MISVNNTVITSEGLLKIKDLIFNYGNVDKEYFGKTKYTPVASEHWNRMYGEAKGYWIKTCVPISVMNQDFELEEIQDIYYHGNMETGILNIQFYYFDAETNKTQKSKLVVHPNYHFWNLDGKPVKAKDLKLNSMVLMLGQESTFAYIGGISINQASIFVSFRLKDGGWGLVYNNHVLGHIGFWPRVNNPESFMSNPGGDICR